MFRRTMAAVGLCVVATVASVVGGAVVPVAGAETSTVATSDRGGVLATYEGRTIDLSEGWGGATVCAEIAVGDVRCYDDDAAYRAAMRLLGALDLNDCPPQWACIWDNRAYQKRRLQWNEPGTKNLADWDFRDRANSAANGRVQGGFALIDQRSFRPDPELIVGAGDVVKDLGAKSYPYGGNWNNKVDKVRL